MNHHFIERPLMKTGIVGLLLLPFVIAMMTLGPPESQIPKGYTSSILAFEFVSDKAELNEVLGDLKDDEKKDLDRINKIDFGFMALYGTFLFLLMSRLSGLLSSELLSKAKWLVPVVVVSDAMENVQLLKLSSHFKTVDYDFERVIGLLGIFTWLKWGLLAVIFAIIAKTLLDHRRNKWIAYILFIPLALCIGAFFSGQRWLEDLFGTSIFLAFFLVFIYCFIYKSRTATTS